MDVYCPRCSEPIDIEEFHERAEEVGQTFDQVREDFRRRGCIALGFTSNQCEPDGSLRSMASAALMDVLGDDIDGVAAMLDEFEFAGMLS